MVSKMSSSSSSSSSCINCTGSETISHHPSRLDNALYRSSRQHLASTQMNVSLCWICTPLIVFKWLIIIIIFSNWLNSSIWSIDGIQSSSTNQGWMEIGVMAMKGYFTFCKALRGKRRQFLWTQPDDAFWYSTFTHQLQKDQVPKRFHKVYTVCYKRIIASIRAVFF